MQFLKNEVKATLKQFSWGRQDIKKAISSHKNRIHQNLNKNKPTNKGNTDWKWSIYISFPKTGDIKDCSNYQTIIIISSESKVMLKILQQRLVTIYGMKNAKYSSWIYNRKRH